MESRTSIFAITNFALATTGRVENLVVVDSNAILKLLLQDIFRGLQILDDPVLILQWCLMVEVPVDQVGL